MLRMSGFFFISLFGFKFLGSTSNMIADSLWQYIFSADNSNDKPINTVYYTIKKFPDASRLTDLEFWFHLNEITQ